MKQLHSLLLQYCRSFFHSESRRQLPKSKMEINSLIFFFIARTVIIDDIMLEDLIEFQQIEF